MNPAVCFDVSPFFVAFKIQNITIYSFGIGFIAIYLYYLFILQAVKWNTQLFSGQTSRRSWYYFKIKRKKKRLNCITAQVIQCEDKLRRLFWYVCKNCDRSSLCIGQRVLFHIHTVQYEDKTNDIVFDIMFFSKIFLKIHTIAIGCVIKSVIGCVRLWVENGKLNFFNLSLYDCSDSSKKH